MAGKIVVFVHGWSVRTTETYGGLPERLASEARRNPELDIDVRQLWLSRYISFHNEVRLEDISRAFDAALHREFGERIAAGDKLVCVTHSTGGPVVRDWLQRFYYSRNKRKTPLSHLIMLAPANFGSALAQLGRTRIGRLKTWFEGVEPGLGVLDWLELGSPEAWELNHAWIDAHDSIIRNGTWPFVLTGTSIDRKMYDHINSYTGEMGSDGVVRAAAANLNCASVRLKQKAAAEHQDDGNPPLRMGKISEVEQVPLRIIEGRSHSGDDMGIMRSVRDNRDDHPTLSTLLRCLQVSDTRSYRQLAKELAAESATVQQHQRVEEQDLPGPFTRTYINDPGSLVIFRVRDDHGNSLSDFEIIFRGANDEADALPPGFLVDRQKNHRQPGTVSFYFNAAHMLGGDEVVHAGKSLRGALPGAHKLGVQIIPYPQSGFVHYLPAELPASRRFLEAVIRPNACVMVDVVMHRVVHEGVFRLSRDMADQDFTREAPGEPI